MPNIPDYTDLSETQSGYKDNPGNDISWHANRDETASAGTALNSYELSVAKIFELFGGGKFGVHTADPTTADDSSRGYTPGSRFYNTTSNVLFICQSNSLGSALWVRANAPKFNPAGGGAPTVSNDDTEGYEAGSIWIDEVGDAVYFCEDATTGAASWIQSGGSGGGGGTYERFKVTKSAAQSVPDSTNTKVELDSVVFNGSNYDAVTNYEWTCPNDMYARISFSVGLEGISSPSTTERAVAYIFVNGSAVAITEDVISDSNQTLELNDIFEFTAGDTVSFHLWQESGASIDISTDTRRTRASIEELP